MHKSQYGQRDSELLEYRILGVEQTVNEDVAQTCCIHVVRTRFGVQALALCLIIGWERPPVESRTQSE